MHFYFALHTQTRTDTPLSCMDVHARTLSHIAHSVISSSTEAHCLLLRSDTERSPLVQAPAGEVYWRWWQVSPSNTLHTHECVRVPKSAASSQSRRRSYQRTQIIPGAICMNCISGPTAGWVQGCRCDSWTELGTTGPANSQPVHMDASQTRAHT